MTSDPVALIEMGRRLRAARLEMRRSQRTVGAHAGVSQAVVSKMELGRGGGVDLETWLSVAGAVGLPLEVGPSSTDMLARCHRLIADVAESGGWTATMEPGETILARGCDRVVVHAWDPVTVVAYEIDRLTASLEQQRAQGAYVSGVVVIPATGANRRRISELRNELRDQFQARGNACYGALVNPRLRMPEQPGILWAFPDAHRLRPATLNPGWIWTAVGDGPRFATGRRRCR